MKFMEVIGKHVQSSGLQLEAWVEGNLLGPKTAEKVMAGKSHDKGMRAHKITVQDCSGNVEDTSSPVAELHVCTFIEITDFFTRDSCTRM